MAGYPESACGGTLFNRELHGSRALVWPMTYQADPADRNQVRI